MPYRGADLTRRSFAGHGVTDERIPAVVDRERTEARQTQDLARGQEPAPNRGTP